MIDRQKYLEEQSTRFTDRWASAEARINAEQEEINKFRHKLEEFRKELNEPRKTNLDEEILARLNDMSR